MDGPCFDALTRSLTGAGSRRRLLAGLAGAALGSLGVRGSVAAACRPVGIVCREHANCCSGLCGAKDATLRRRCRCQTAADCPTPSDPCFGATCLAGLCGETVLVGQACDDGDACITGEVCQVDGTCGGGAPVDCSAFVDACHTSACNPANGTCLTQTFGDGTPCVSADPCAVDPTCQSGVCTPASVIQCLACSECSGGGCAAVADGTSCGQSAACVGGICKFIQCLACSHLEGVSCVPDADGTSCGQSAVCISGSCEFIQCLACQHLEGISCVADPDGTPCGPNMECVSGSCVPE